MAWFGKKKEEKVVTPPPIRTGKGHPGTFEGPVNDLERAIVAVRNRDLPTPKFIEYFLNANAFVAVPEGQFEKTEDGVKLVRNPTLFTVSYPEYTCIAFYSDESRLKPTSDQFPEFRYAVSVCVGDLVMGIPSSFGLIINPYWDVNLEWNAQQVAGIKKMITG